MTRGYLINHLIESDCAPDEECDSQTSQLWHNRINGHVCYVPYEEELQLMTFSHIFFELGIAPPAEYEDDYAVYSSFRIVRERRLNELQAQNNDTED
ncbi:hypothetical protein [Ferruginibacter albus]|uniref:hypothetical protein n=1 Tax=Ferruginibacter albus TaxID=2875540 RepID=UPI001CC6FAB7|nr:hypothetical protein [Ferruginibacter albus]UAY53439.1 hypothetical protein K9M53_07135 [Ferruginibacter albus]